MYIFDKSQQNALRSYLNNCYIHDADICSFQHNKDNNTLSIRMENSLFNQDITIILSEVKLFYTASEPISNSRDSVFSLTVEDEKTADVWNREDNKNMCIYLLIQMLSGLEIHILAQTVKVNCTSLF